MNPIVDRQDHSSRRPGPLRATPGTGSAARRPSTPARALAGVVEFALGTLANLRDPHPSVTSGVVELRLRDAVDAIDRGTRARATAPERPAFPDGVVSAAIAVRTACAHLAAGQLEDCYLALCVAADFLAGQLD